MGTGRKAGTYRKLHSKNKGLFILFLSSFTFLLSPFLSPFTLHVSLLLSLLKPFLTECYALLCPFLSLSPFPFLSLSFPRFFLSLRLLSLKTPSILFMNYWLSDKSSCNSQELPHDYHRISDTFSYDSQGFPHDDFLDLRQFSMRLPEVSL